jgi:hypothetical protein
MERSSNRNGFLTLVLAFSLRRFINADNPFGMYTTQQFTPYHIASSPYRSSRIFALSINSSHNP